MTNTGLNTEVDDFKELPTDVQRAVLFKAVVDLGKKIEDHDPAPKCAERFEALERMRKWNMAAAGGGGLLGGFIAMLAKIAFWK